MNKDEKVLHKALEAQGFDITRTRNGHFLVYKDGRCITTMAGTGSDPRGRLNTIARLRRAGFKWEGR